ncbi:response regulator [Pseudooceanicola onchidii]|uniref:response regulator n=1 Tax=Pseudooceanicola onchidii TaxID=2562279 RepID=UPI0010AAE5D8|nr:response regulator [Pseudooceanicola onchidii]
MDRVSRSFEILLVEDDAIIRMDLALCLSDLGHSVREAADADKAVALITDGMNFDLLVTDIDMPGSMDGLALAAYVRDLQTGCHILIISGGTHLPPADLPLGCVCLRKPLMLSDLESALSKFEANH